MGMMLSLSLTIRKMSVINPIRSNHPIHPSSHSQFHYSFSEFSLSCSCMQLETKVQCGEAAMSKKEKNPGIINLNAPLLSTRRPFFRFRQPPLLPPTQERIPFSWELAPGLPKSSYHDDSSYDLQENNHGYYCCYDNPASARDSFSTSKVNADDIFSLSEAIDVLEKSEEPAAQESDSNLTALKRMAESGEDTSPSFMINRFLPDANALVASSASRYYYYSRSWKNKTSYGSYSSGCTGTRDEVKVEAEGRRYRKACGMERVFQWRMKPRFLCGDSRSLVLRPPSILGNRRNHKPS